MVVVDSGSCSSSGALAVSLWLCWGYNNSPCTLSQHNSHAPVLLSIGGVDVCCYVKHKDIRSFQRPQSPDLITVPSVLLLEDLTAVIVASPRLNPLNHFQQVGPHMATLNEHPSSEAVLIQSHVDVSEVPTGSSKQWLYCRRSAMSVRISLTRACVYQCVKWTCVCMRGLCLLFSAL